eukprot:3116877-Rhodomonas_salina.3
MTNLGLGADHDDWERVARILQYHAPCQYRTWPSARVGRRGSGSKPVPVASRTSRSLLQPHRSIASVPERLCWYAFRGNGCTAHVRHHTVQQDQVLVPPYASSVPGSAHRVRRIIAYWEVAARVEELQRLWAAHARGHLSKKGPKTPRKGPSGSRNGRKRMRRAQKGTVGIDERGSEPGIM